MSLCPNCSNQLLDGHTICLSCGHLINNPNLKNDSLLSVVSNETFSGSLCDAPENEAGVHSSSGFESSLPEIEDQP